MKKIIMFTLCVALSLVFSAPLFAVELSPEAVQAKKVPASYATIENGQIVFGKHATAYSPDTLDRILRAYGLMLSSDANIPSSYATVKDGNIIFKKGATAYSPDVLHEILTSYDLTLSPEEAERLKDPPNYVKVKNGNLIFGTRSTAYSPEEFNMLMAAYQLPIVPVEIEEEPAAQPEPEPIEEPEEEEEITQEPRIEEIPEPEEEEEVVVVCPDEDGDGICDDVDDCPGTPRGAYVNDRGCWIIENILFDFDKAIIKAKYYPDLDEIVRVLNENPDLSVEVQGHTCWIGTKRYNQKLSERRAKAVVEYFKKKGIDPSRISWKGYGETKPAFPNTEREGRIKNRRVELQPKN
jgi:OOP family OmpA-OmpF porin